MERGQVNKNTTGSELLDRQDFVCAGVQKSIGYISSPLGHVANKTEDCMLNIAGVLQHRVGNPCIQLLDKTICVMHVSHVDCTGPTLALGQT